MARTNYPYGDGPHSQRGAVPDAPSPLRSRRRPVRFVVNEPSWEYERVASQRPDRNIWVQRSAPAFIDLEPVSKKDIPVKHTGAWLFGGLVLLGAVVAGALYVEERYTILESTEPMATEPPAMPVDDFVVGISTAAAVPEKYVERAEGAEGAADEERTEANRANRAPDDSAGEPAPVTAAELGAALRGTADSSGAGEKTAPTDERQTTEARVNERQNVSGTEASEPLDPSEADDRSLERQLDDLANKPFSDVEP